MTTADDYSSCEWSSVRVAIRCVRACALEQSNKQERHTALSSSFLAVANALAFRLVSNIQYHSDRSL
jgi:hypothetical protein